METTLYKITFDDGRVFKVFCANKHQKRRLTTTITSSENETVSIDVLESGIHTIKQWEDIIKEKETIFITKDDTIREDK